MLMTSGKLSSSKAQAQYLMIKFCLVTVGVTEWIECTRFFHKKFFLHSTENFLTFSPFQYQNFIKTFSVKIFEFQCLAHAH